jgi:hypothetical protein
LWINLVLCWPQLQLFLEPKKTNWCSSNIYVCKNVPINEIIGGLLCCR